MEIVNKIDTGPKVDELSEKERDDLFTQLVMGKDATEEVETSRGKFVVKYPKGSDMMAIGRIAAYRRDYKPASAFDVQTDMLNVMASTLDAVVVSGPPWFEAAKTANKNFTFLEVPSREFINELYGKAYTFRVQVDKRFEAEAGSGDKRVPAEPGATAAVDGGAFGGLASE
jgi:hypothetical protein